MPTRTCSLHACHSATDCTAIFYKIGCREVHKLCSKSTNDISCKMFSSFKNEVMHFSFPFTLKKKKHIWEHGIGAAWEKIRKMHFLIQKFMWWPCVSLEFYFAVSFIFTLPFFIYKTVNLLNLFAFGLCSHSLHNSNHSYRITWGERPRKFDLIWDKRRKTNQTCRYIAF